MGKASRRKGKKKGHKRTDKVYTPLNEQKRIGKHVVPPFAMLEREAPVQRTDWTGDRLPEMIWAALLIAAYGRDVALDRIRRVARQIGDRIRVDESRSNVLSDVTMSGLAEWSDEEFGVFAEIVLGEAPGVFAPLLGFNRLPSRGRWERAIVAAGDRGDLSMLSRAVALSAFHQSQEATDCRWARVLAVLISGRLKFPFEMKTKVEELFEYPNQGDMRSVRPMIRSTEGSIDFLQSGGKPATTSDWALSFWNEAFEKTRDDHPRLPRATAPLAITITRDEVMRLRASILTHSSGTTAGSEVDPKHEGAFGIATYALDLLGEVFALGNSTRIVGRMSLRALAEARLTMAYLCSGLDPDGWQKYRAYGAGQAKLAYLKLLDTEHLPEFVTLEDLERLANEDMWHEFREIALGNWAGSDLRKMSEASGLKEAVYDNYYDWTSAFVHGNWGAVRDAVYDLCMNPLHRLHRVLSDAPQQLPDVVADAWRLVHGILEDLNRMYPGVHLPAAPKERDESDR